MRVHFFRFFIAFLPCLFSFPCYASHVAGDPCDASEVGKTEIDTYRKHIIGCLITDDGTSQIWKNFSISSAQCPKNKVLKGLDSSGGPICTNISYAGAFMKNLDETCRYPNPLTGACSCPAGSTEYHSFDFVNNVYAVFPTTPTPTDCPNGYYHDQGEHGLNCGIVGYTCVYTSKD